jgi:hypothetical protein
MYALENKQILAANGGKNTLLPVSLFTPCTASESLLIADITAAKNAPAEDVLLILPACSNLDRIRNHQHRGMVLRAAACGTSTGRAFAPRKKAGPKMIFNLCRGIYEEKTPLQKTNKTTTSQERTPTSAIVQ